MIHVCATYYEHDIRHEHCICVCAQTRWVGCQRLAQSCCTRNRFRSQEWFPTLPCSVLLVCHSTPVTPGTFSRSALKSFGFKHERGLQFDEGGLGLFAVLEPRFVLAIAIVGYVMTLAARSWPAARGWPAGGGRGTSCSLIEGALRHCAARQKDKCKHGYC